MRNIKQIHSAEYAPINDLMTYRVLPTQSLNYLDPFLFLNHHGPQVYPPNNRGLPFGPHPHRGMETVTFILEGDIAHKDSGGGESIMTAGGVQWMTAGRGLIHTEVSSDHFKKYGGPLEILQLWINLPAKSKMAEPFYRGLQQDKIPTIILDEGKVTVNLIAGQWDGYAAAFESGKGVQLNTIYLATGGVLDLQVPRDHTVFFYVIRGKLDVNHTDVISLQLVEFNPDGEDIHVEAKEDSILLFGHAKPLQEPVVAQGPFVMNTQQQIVEAYDDYRKGKFGVWRE
jgi:redox-sensitive bicupin YhaK (pirin superfamily)